jgi:hypothetical protein
MGPKQPVEQVAAAIVSCVKRPVPELYPHRLSRGLAVMNILAPRLSDRFVHKYGRKRVE